MFEINKRLFLVDLPGYGYAKLSMIIREQLSILIQSYLEQRLNLKKTYILIDCKIGIKESDIDSFDLIAKTNNVFTIILTKTDKCSKNFIMKQKISIASLMQNYQTRFTIIIVASSKNNDGIIFESILINCCYDSPNSII